MTIATEPITTLLVTEREAAELLGVCSKTVFNLAKAGELRPVKIGRAVRYSVDDLRQFIQAKQNTGVENA